MESLKADPVHGLDGRWSWITAALCSWVLFLAMSGVCASGVLYYGIIDTFGTTREEASWPVTLPDSLLNLAGALMGLLCRWFSCRTVLLVCCLLTGFGISICFFARGILFLSIMFGALHGYCRDKLGKYDMLLHILAAVNFVVACVWTLRLLVRRQRQTKEVATALHGQANHTAGKQLPAENSHHATTYTS